MREIDTSAEVVERLAAKYDNGLHHEQVIAATLRALAAERDAAVRNYSDAQKYAEHWASKCDRLAAENARLQEALQRWQHYGCPDCGGDCGSANPPVSCCIMQETRAALAPEPGHD